MPGIDYNAIAEAFKDILESHPDMQTPDSPTVVIEPDVRFSMEEEPWIEIYFLGRRAVESDQRLAAGTETLYECRYLIFVATQHAESIADAVKARNDLISRVERVLMEDRTLRDTVGSLWLEGGNMGRGPGENGGNIADGEIEVMVTAVSTTD